LPFLSAAAGVDIDPKDTLIIFDGIQAIPNALTALKFFYEEAPEYHIISAGSTL
jgi:predicted AAA+ superfamily ATPase